MSIVKDCKVSIIMLTYNAKKYVKESIDTLREHTKGVDYELIVSDNKSRLFTRNLVKQYKKKGMIDKLLLNPSNLLFAKGNNAGAKLCDKDSTHILLINSDVRIQNDNWLKNLLEICPEGGISSYGYVEESPSRADGFCFLVDREFYDANNLDENYEWFWSITKLQAIALNQGRQVVAVKNHEDMLHHYGQKSGHAYHGAKGMDEDINHICSWFAEHSITVLEHIGDGL